MSQVYVPYQGQRPAFVSINGHRLLILSRSKGIFSRSLGHMGADRVKKFNLGDTRSQQEKSLRDLATKTEAGIVLAGPDVRLDEVIQTLTQELPWIH